MPKLTPSVAQALQSFRELKRIMPHLSEAEVLEALAWEKAAPFPRKHVVNLLISRAINLYRRKLNGP